MKGGADTVAWKARERKKAVREVEGDGSGRERGQLERYRKREEGGAGVEEREREVKSESVISEAVLNRALRQDVLYMLMFLPHTRTHTHTQSRPSFVF